MCLNDSVTIHQHVQPSLAVGLFIFFISWTPTSKQRQFNACAMPEWVRGTDWSMTAPPCGVNNIRFDVHIEICLWSMVYGLSYMVHAHNANMVPDCHCSASKPNEFEKRSMKSAATFDITVYACGFLNLILSSSIRHKLTQVAH